MALLHSGRLCFYNYDSPSPWQTLLLKLWLSFTAQTFLLQLWLSFTVADFVITTMAVLHSGRLCFYNYDSPSPWQTLLLKLWLSFTVADFVIKTMALLRRADFVVKTMTLLHLGRLCY